MELHLNTIFSLIPDLRIDKENLIKIFRFNRMILATCLDKFSLRENRKERTPYMFALSHFSTDSTSIFFLSA